MTVKIQDSIARIERQIAEEMENSPDRQTSLTALRLQEKSVAAILGGSAAWEPYMTEFAKDEGGVLDTAALARLMPDGNLERDQARAYLIGNGNCGALSVSGPGISFGVGNKLDFGLPEEDV